MTCKSRVAVESGLKGTFRGTGDDRQTGHPKPGAFEGWPPLFGNGYSDSSAVFRVLGDLGAQATTRREV